MKIDANELIPSLEQCNVWSRKVAKICTIHRKNREQQYTDDDWFPSHTRLHGAHSPLLAGAGAVLTPEGRISRFQ
jgi:hypothetical protein